MGMEIKQGAEFRRNKRLKGENKVPARPGMVYLSVSVLFNFFQDVDRSLWDALVDQIPLH